MERSTPDRTTSCTTLQIRSAEADLDLSVQVSAGEVLLLGRRPEPARIDWELLRGQLNRLGVSLPSPDPPLPVRVVAVASSRASANHLLILALEDRALILDLESRNGSWLRLHAHQPCVVPLAGDLTVVLSSPEQAPALRSQPPDARWSGHTDFGAAIARSLGSWLSAMNVAFSVKLHPASSVVSQALPLADGQLLELHPTGTLQIPAAELGQRIRRYVYDQNARYSQLERRVAGMIVESASMRTLLLRMAEAAAAGRRTVLLGPTGVGKELLARSYHGYSARQEGPFVSVNCALLDKSLLYAQLFGARRGSFTGAVADVPGLIEAADGGTLFLDELGEMPLDVQAALLRFLDTRGEYCRLGETQPRRVSVQVVCAANVPLDDPDYRSGRFRHDLWYRLAAAVLLVPPLRERRDDILACLHSRTLGPGGPTVASCLAPAALELVLSDEWPGNFRDLENFVERLPRTADPGSLSVELCQRLLHEGRARVRPLSAAVLPAASSEARASGREAARAGRTEVAMGDASVDATTPPDGWPRIVGEALSAFISDHREEPIGWHQLHRFIEQYLKPSYVGHHAESLDLPIAGPGVNYSALARALHVADGKTVKTHLGRFEERFSRGGSSPTETATPATSILSSSGDSDR